MSLDDQTLIKPYVQVKGHYNNSRGFVLDDGRFMFLDGETLVTLSETTGRTEETLAHGLSGRVRVVANGDGTKAAVIGCPRIVEFTRQDDKWIETCRHESPAAYIDCILGGTTDSILLRDATDSDHLVIPGGSAPYPAGDHLTMSANGQVAARLACDNDQLVQIKIFHPWSGEAIQTIQQEPKLLGVGDMSFSPSGAYLAVWTLAGYLSIYKTKTGRYLFRKHIRDTVNGPVISMAVSDDMSHVVTANDRETFLFDTKSGIWQPLHEVRTVRFLPDGTLVGHQSYEMRQCRNGVTLWTPTK